MFFELKMQTVEGFINSENKHIDTSVAEHYIKDASQRLKVCLEYYMTEPKAHLESYSESPHGCFVTKYENNLKTIWFEKWE